MRRSALGVVALMLGLSLVAGAASRGATTPGAALVGRWAGTVTQKGAPSFRLTLTLSAPVKSRVGRVTIPSSKCVGRVRYTGTKAGRLLFKMTWQKGKCLAGTASLRSLGRNRLSYRWAGKYADGSRAASSATLRRTQ
ncbi:MAG TPA: hypothetical protein VF379_05510 [Gaiellaceae bacterium]